MLCFRHHEQQATGVCRGCGKGVCGECVRDLGVGLACSDVCAERVTLFEALNRKAGATYASASRNTWLGPAFLAAMGLLFAVVGLLGPRDPMNVSTLMGALFVAFGATLYLKNRRWAREVGKEQ